MAHNCEVSSLCNKNINVTIVTYSKGNIAKAHKIRQIFWLRLTRAYDILFCSAMVDCFESDSVPTLRFLHSTESYLCNLLKEINSARDNTYKSSISLTPAIRMHTMVMMLPQVTNAHGSSVYSAEYSLLELFLL